MTGEPRRTFTRARTVEHTAHSYLSARGYQVFLCSGSQSPVDLIAWNREGHPALIKTERTRVAVGSAAQVAKRYRGDLDALRTIILPQLARVQLWILSPPFGSWRFFTVFPGYSGGVGMPIIAPDCRNDPCNLLCPVCDTPFWHREGGYIRCRDCGVEVTITEVTITEDKKNCHVTLEVQAP